MDQHRQPRQRDASQACGQAKVDIPDKAVGPTLSAEKPATRSSLDDPPPAGTVIGKDNIDAKAEFAAWVVDQIKNAVNDNSDFATKALPGFAVAIADQIGPEAAAHLLRATTSRSKDGRTSAIDFLNLLFDASVEHAAMTRGSDGARTARVSHLVMLHGLATNPEIAKQLGLTAGQKQELVNARDKWVGVLTEDRKQALRTAVASKNKVGELGALADLSGLAVMIGGNLPDVTLSTANLAAAIAKLTADLSGAKPPVQVLIGAANSFERLLKEGTGDGAVRANLIAGLANVYHLLGENALAALRANPNEQQRQAAQIQLVQAFSNEARLRLALDDFAGALQVARSLPEIRPTPKHREHRSLRRSSMPSFRLTGRCREPNRSSSANSRACSRKGLRCCAAGYQRQGTG